MNAPETFLSQLIANIARNLAQAETKYAARQGYVFRGAERVAVASSGTFARKIAYSLNQMQQTSAFLKAMEAVLTTSGDDAALAAIRRAMGDPND